MAEELYDALRACIDEQLERLELSSFELVGVLSLLTAEVQAVAMDDSGEEGGD